MYVNTNLICMEMPMSLYYAYIYMYGIPVEGHLYFLLYRCGHWSTKRRVPRPRKLGLKNQVCIWKSLYWVCGYRPILRVWLQAYIEGVLTGLYCGCGYRLHFFYPCMYFFTSLCCTAWCTLGIQVSWHLLLAVYIMNITSFTCRLLTLRS